MAHLRPFGTKKYDISEVHFHFAEYGTQPKKEEEAAKEKVVEEVTAVAENAAVVADGAEAVPN